MMTNPDQSVSKKCQDHTIMRGVQCIPRHSKFNLEARIQSELREFIKTRNWNSPFAVTLTLKQGVSSPETGIVYLTRDLASQNFRHFLNMLNRSVFGKSAERNGKRVSSMVVLEGGGDTRLHVHAILDCPRNDLVQMFPCLIHATWQKTLWGYEQSKVERCLNSGWINYISKYRDKPDYALAFDWTNCHFE